MKITVGIFFRSITVRNKELIPAKGPLLILANHPSTFMDPIVIATLINRKVYFLAKGELFKSKFTRWLLPKFNMIPVYRKQDNPDLMNKNEDTFNKCFEHLEKGGAILMFPEGISITERKLKPIKTGAARIALGAEAKNNFELGVQITNIGLNYENPHRFNRDLFVNINKPIDCKNYEQEYKSDGIKAVQLLTNEITLQLEKIVIDIEDKKTDELVASIETLYKNAIRQTAENKEDKSSDFLITKNIIEVVNYYSVIDPQKVLAMKNRLNNYFKALDELGIDDNGISKSLKKQSFLGSNFQSVLFIISGFPIYVYGIVNNFLAFEIPGFIARKTTKTIEFRGAIGMVGGVFTFSLFYTLQIAAVWKYSHSEWITLTYGLSLPLTGLFAYWYYYSVIEIKNKWLLMMTFYKKSVFVANLISERESILKEFNMVRDEYFSQKE